MKPHRKNTKAIEISIVVPLHNEAERVERFFRELCEVLIREKLEYEIICVNDGSTDLTGSHLLKARESNNRIRIIQLSRRFGKDIALTAGLDHAQGQAVIPLDADLLDPPELIPHLISKWRDGYQVVNARRAERMSDSWLRRSGGAAFHKLFNSLSRTRIPESVENFCLLDRDVVEALKCLPERDRFMNGLLHWVGFRTADVTYERSRRSPIASKWRSGKLLISALDRITAFSTSPLRLVKYFGFGVAMMSFLYASFLLLWTIFLGTNVPGYASIIVTVLFLGGIQLVSIGVVGEYVGRISTEVKQRPLYLVQKVHGFDGPKRDQGD